MAKRQAEALKTRSGPEQFLDLWLHANPDMDEFEKRFNHLLGSVKMPKKERRLLASGVFLSQHGREQVLEVLGNFPKKKQYKIRTILGRAAALRDSEKVSQSQ